MSKPAVTFMPTATAGQYNGETSFGLTFGLYGKSAELIFFSPCCHKSLLLPGREGSPLRCSGCLQEMELGLTHRLSVEDSADGDWATWCEFSFDVLTAVVVGAQLRERVRDFLTAADADPQAAAKRLSGVL